MARYLVTGAAGFIASRVSQLLLERGDEVVGIDTMNDAYDPALKHFRLKSLEALDGFQFAQADIADRDALAEVFARSGGFDGVINLAARAGVRQSVENPWVYIETNVTGTLNLLELSKRHEVAKFVLASTSSLYGAHNQVPYSETADSSRPLSPYAASKGAAEALCHSYHHLTGIDVTVFRFFTVFGPAGRPDMSIFRFIQWVAEGRPVTIFGDGKQSRDFTYVDDIARGVIAGLRPVGHALINLGSDGPYELIDVLRRIEARLGRTAEIEWREFHRADVRGTWADISVARDLLDWRPQVSLDEGLERTVAWYEANRDWARDVRTD